MAGNSHKAQIPEMIFTPSPITGRSQSATSLSSTIFFRRPVEDALGDRTRPNLKIQDGCNNRCSFCIIPFVRGRSRSAQPDDVVTQVRELAEKYKEVVLSGINLGRWGRDAEGRLRLADLVRRLLNETPIERLRFSSVEPMDWSDDLLSLVAESPESPSMSMRHCNPGRTPFCAACIANIAPGIMPTASGRRVVDVLLRRGRRRDDRLPRRDRPGVRGIAGFHRKPAFHLPARVHLFRAARHTGGGIVDQVPKKSASIARTSCATWRRRRTWLSVAAWWARVFRW